MALQILSSLQGSPRGLLPYDTNLLVSASSAGKFQACNLPGTRPQPCGTAVPSLVPWLTRSSKAGRRVSLQVLIPSSPDIWYVNALELQPGHSAVIALASFHTSTDSGDLFFCLHHISDSSYRTHVPFCHHLKRQPEWWAVMRLGSAARISNTISVVFMLEHTLHGILDQTLKAKQQEEAEDSLVS